MTTTTKRIFERMGGAVDANAGIIAGVKLLGQTSKNGRRYSERAMRDAVPLYADVKVYVDHPRQSEREDDRRFSDWAGVVRNPRFEGGAIFGDIHLRQKGRDYEAIMEAAEKFAGCFGMSHVADGDSRYDAGTEVVESIESVFSVDLVTEPATAAGLFESTLGDPAFEYMGREEMAPVSTCREGLLLVEQLENLVKQHQPPEPLATLAGHIADVAGRAFKAVLSAQDVPPPAPVLESFHAPRTKSGCSEPGSFAARYGDSGLVGLPPACGGGL